MKKKVALVTGGSQGIGKAIAARLIKDGFDISIVAIGQQKLDEAKADLESKGGNVIAINANVADQQAFSAAINQTVEQLGDLNVVVNNAGIAPTTPIDTVTPEQFQNVYSVNVGGVLWGMQAAHKAFKKLGHGGKIINATSQAGVVGNPNLVLYSGSKFAVRGMTQVAARDFAADDVNVNAYAPGIVKTPMMYKVAHQVGQNAGKSDEWGMESFAKDITLKRLSEPEDVANVVSFLAGPDSDYITGQTIIVDGGMQFN